MHYVDWEEPEVGTPGSVGAGFISKVIFMENKKKDAIQLLNIVLLDEVSVDVMPDDKFIVYHMKAYMDRAQPRFLPQNKRISHSFFVVADLRCSYCTV